MFLKIIIQLLVFVSFCQSKNYWSWDCENASKPTVNYLVAGNTMLSSTSPHSGLKCMQLSISGLGGNQSAGADVNSIVLGKINNGQWFYYRWWMKFDVNFKWGQGTGYTKASRMKRTDESLASQLWTGYVGKQGVFLHESSVLPAYYSPDGVLLPYNFQGAAGTGWHEYIVAMKMQTGAANKDGEFHFYVDGKLFGSKKQIQFMNNDVDCSEAWNGWMVNPYFQLNGTTTDGGLMWLDDYSMDDQWNSIYTSTTPTPIPIITSATSATSRICRPFSFQITATQNPVAFSAQYLPSGLTISPTSGLISGVVNKKGTYYTIVTAKNNLSASKPTSLTITILDSLSHSKPKIQCVEVTKDISDSSVIFSADFEDLIPLDQKFTKYSPHNNDCAIIDSVGFGGSKHSVRARWTTGQVDAGGFSLMFGSNPAGSSLNTNAKYNDIYWRAYMLMEEGWLGNPNKVSRATILTSTSWQQAMVAHIWGDQNDSVISIDPASGVSNGKVVTTQYNDFANLKWLGKIRGVTPLYSTRNSGMWYCIESHVKLNTPGIQDGVFELWVNGNLEARSSNLNWVDTWNLLGINTIMFENYCNTGSLRNQQRFIDNIVIAKKPIGLSPSPVNPAVMVSPAPAQSTIEIEVSTSKSTGTVIWRGRSKFSQIRIDSTFGKFIGAFQNYKSLPNSNFYLHARYLLPLNDSTEWSEWKMFRVLAQNITIAGAMKQISTTQSIFPEITNNQKTMFGLQIINQNDVKITGERLVKSISLSSISGRIIRKSETKNHNNLFTNFVSNTPPGVYLFLVEFKPEANKPTAITKKISLY